MQVNAYTEVTDNEVLEFHLNRRLFVDIGGNILYEDKPSGLSHHEFIRGTDPDKLSRYLANLSIEHTVSYLIDNYNRGYLYNGVLAIYKGVTFDADSTTVDFVRYNLSQLVEYMNIPGNTQVVLGLQVRDKPIFSSLITVGSIDEVLSMENYDHIYKAVEKIRWAI